MSLVAWNVKGLNKGYKRRELKLFIKEHNMGIIAIVEHRIKEDKEASIINKIAPGWD